MQLCVMQNIFALINQFLLKQRKQKHPYYKEGRSTITVIMQCYHTPPELPEQQQSRWCDKQAAYKSCYTM